MDARVKKIYDVASRMFIKQGYALTQVDHIVKETGISVGALYDLFSGKKAILKFILKCTIEPDFLEREIELPITEELFFDLNDEIKKFLEKTDQQFSEPMKMNMEDYTFEQMLADAFHVIQQYRVGCLIIEKNPAGCGKLFDYYQDYRKKFYKSILEYVKIYIGKGIIRELESPELAVIFIVESMTWWAMDIRYDTFEPRDYITDEIAEKTCLDALINSYKIK